MSIQVKIMVGLAVAYIGSLVVQKYLESRILEPVDVGPLQVITEPETDPGISEV